MFIDAFFHPCWTEIGRNKDQVIKLGVGDTSN